MARCPYAPHRLFVQAGACRRCGGGVQLFAAVQALPVSLFNGARRLWDAENLEAAAAMLAEALRFRPDFAEAHWLMAAVEAARGRLPEARTSLGEAARLGAAVELSWLDAPPQEAAEASELPSASPAPPELELPSDVPPDSTASAGNTQEGAEVRLDLVHPATGAFHDLFKSWLKPKEQPAKSGSSAPASKD